MREAISAALTDDKYSVQAAADGLQGLNTLRASQQPMIVVLDYLMPHLSGGEVLAAVAQDAALAARCAFILCTANNRTLPLSVARLLTDMQVTVLPKPFDLDDLFNAVDIASERLAGGGKGKKK